jgi:hypothetical protein
MNTSKTSDDTAATEILRLLAERGAGRSLDPAEVAKALTPDGDEVHRQFHRVRAAAVGLARGGRAVILRKGKPVDPDDFRGVYRIGLPMDVTD